MTDPLSFVLLVSVVAIAILIMRGAFLVFLENPILALVVLILLTPLFVVWAFVKGLVG